MSRKISITKISDSVLTITHPDSNSEFRLIQAPTNPVTYLLVSWRRGGNAKEIPLTHADAQLFLLNITSELLDLSDFWNGQQRLL